MKSKIKKSLGNLSKKVTTADKIDPIVYEVTELNNFGFSELKPMVNTIKFEVAEWIKEVEAYCGEMGILPADLIETHRQSLKVAKIGKKQSKDKEITERPTHSNWFENYRKAKTGYPAPK